MNFYQFFEQKLNEYGLLPNQVSAVMKELHACAEKSGSDLTSMRDRWTDHVDGYPPGFADTAFFLAKPVIYKWIVQNAPKAWFRPAFAPGVDNLRGQELNDFIDNYRKQHMSDQ